MVSAKRKNLPKLKTILANPNKDKCPTLDDAELQQLGQLLSDAINSSGLKPHQFATSTHIRLGLESSLRAINNCKCSCVLLSLTIQPRFLVRLIARNVEAKDETVPVYVQKQLEDFTKEVFGVRALALVLPTIEEMRETKLDGQLLNWVKLRTKPMKPKLVKAVPKPVKPKLVRAVPKNVNLGNKGAIETKKEEPSSLSHTIDVENSKNPQEGDFISFSEAMEIDKADSEEDEEQLVAVLRKVAECAENQNTSQKTPKTDCFNDIAHAEEKFDDAVSSDTDNFLPEIYQPLTVHKIQPQPQKKPKKARKKKSKQKKN